MGSICAKSAPEPVQKPAEEKPMEHVEQVNVETEPNEEADGGEEEPAAEEEAEE